MIQVRVRAWLLVVLFPIFWEGCAIAAKIGDPQLDLERLIPQLIKEHRVPGVSVAIITDAEITWQNGFGVRDASTGTAVDTNTIFQAASMSKPVFAALVLKLADQEVLTLDKPLAGYEKKRFLEGDSLFELITARQILSHSSGLPTWRTGDQPLKTVAKPGSTYLYSGEGYCYLQTVVTGLIGKWNTNDCAQYEAGVTMCASNFEELMQTNLLGPLGMNSSSYSWSPGIQGNLARGHDSDSKPLPLRAPRYPDISRYGAAGALLTTPSDYARFIVGLMKALKGEAVVLRKADVKEMIKSQAQVQEGVWWGLGWGMENFGKVKVISHGGDNSGFHCFAVWSVDTNRGYVIMTNGDTGVPLIREFLEAMRGFIENKN